jgi:geranylgeranyl pyrophosphate synthase
MTYPAVYGREASRAAAVRLVNEACRALEPIGPRGDELKSLAQYVIERRG